MPPHPPAYNPVPARTTLARPEQPAQPSLGKPRKVDWPQPVRDYVGRAFEPQNVIEGISPAEMQAKLKDLISFFAGRNQLESLDWTTYPLPQQLLVAERRAALPPVEVAPGFANNVPPAPVHSSGLYTNNNSSSPQSARKRKSNDASDDLPTVQAEDNLPPWRKTNTASLKDRITYGNNHNEKRHKKNDSTSKSFEADLEKRKNRFNLGKSGNQTTPPWSSSRNDSDSDMPTGPVVGTNQSLEKRYFRLTAPPKPETVRPQHVLEKTLDLLKKKWREESNYGYICNQFKSLRQDLTVQHIKNSFTVSVYEIHARIALEKGDLGEYNQCQTQLKALYKQKLGGHPAEFTAYRILYTVYTCNKADMNDLLAELTLTDKAPPAVRHALDVRSALALGNFHKFFRLYLAAPNMGAYLMDMFIERERLHALANISRAYVTVALRFLTDELGFDSDNDCIEFLTSHGAENLVEQKTNDKNESQLRVKIKEGAGLFDSLRAAAFSKVDIKGQI
ncbi:SAC3/GANP/Nin1/mts3/eIF-3 p25 family-domain-containing protein [Lophiotrema nucula]|uniref:SAC3/GANP/Nin1/mts3/eIF-3 p25 family-domain-containing protein n=1 Tax=Lophiotrema nucula TaxID=690887 RepID=A0A6A5Z3C3_9PLEO|nr:SAC3/GANP/Nin1/mts3/eIF-3 p25 family-domain-containing protein [Lophiotrema nucula]